MFSQVVIVLLSISSLAIAGGNNYRSIAGSFNDNYSYGINHQYNGAWQGAAYPYGSGGLGNGYGGYGLGGGYVAGIIPQRFNGGYGRGYGSGYGSGYGYGFGNGATGFSNYNRLYRNTGYGLGAYAAGYGQATSYANHNQKSTSSGIYRPAWNGQGGLYAGNNNPLYNQYSIGNGRYGGYGNGATSFVKVNRFGHGYGYGAF